MSYIHCFHSFLSKMREDAHIKGKNNECKDEEKIMKKYLLLNSDQTSLSDPIEYLPELLTDEIIWKRIGLTGAWIELLKPWNYWPNIETTVNMTTFNKSQVLFKFWLKTWWTIVEIKNFLKCEKMNMNKNILLHNTHIYFSIYQNLLRYMKDFWHKYIFHLTVLKLIVAIGDKLISFSSFRNQFCVWEPSSTGQFS